MGTEPRSEHSTLTATRHINDAGASHSDAVRAFLSGDARQVWVRVLSTGEAEYIEEGSAERRREEAKVFRTSTGTEKWGCIVPDCNVRITFAGRTKRDHYKHDGAYAHPGSGEGVDHLAAKAMLSTWAQKHLGSRATVEEEAPIAAEGMMRSRRADVMVTGVGGRRLDLEVEYKAYQPDQWAEKQADLDAAGVACTWLVGHTRLASISDDLEGGAVSLTPLARAIARSGRPVLAVNPEKRQVATVAHDPFFEQRLTGYEYFGFIRIDSLDDCELDPIQGLVTPSLKLLDQQAAVREKREADENAARMRKQRAAQLAADERQQRWDRIVADNEKRWHDSDLHSQIHSRFSTLPPILERSGIRPGGVHAVPAHWHTAIHENLLYGRVGSTFTTRDCAAVLAQSGIKTSPIQSKALRSLFAFLDALEKNGLLRRTGKYQWTVRCDLDTLSART